MHGRARGAWARAGWGHAPPPACPASWGRSQPASPPACLPARTSRAPTTSLTAPPRPAFPAGSTLESPAQGNFHNVTPCPLGGGGVWKQGFGGVDKEAIELGAAAGEAPRGGLVASYCVLLLCLRAGPLPHPPARAPPVPSPCPSPPPRAAPPHPAAGIDLQGTNAGYIYDDDDFDTDEEHDPAGGGGGDAGPSGRVDEQQAYIAELEERNLNLQERVYLLEKELNAYRQRAQGVEAVSDDGEEGLKSPGGSGGGSPGGSEGAHQQHQQHQQEHAAGSDS